MKSKFFTISSRVFSSRFFVKYNSALETHPLMTKCITSGVIGIVSDSVAQTCFDNAKSFDVMRLFNLYNSGLIYFPFSS